MIRSPEAQKMYDFRKQNNMSMASLAEATGLDDSTLSVFESRTILKPVQHRIHAKCSEIGLNFSEFEISDSIRGGYRKRKDAKPLETTSTRKSFISAEENFKRRCEEDISLYIDAIKKKEDSIMVEMESIEKMKGVLESMKKTLSQLEELV
jgi:transcriptional regulator with XRE-family HTH domain